MYAQTREMKRGISPGRSFVGVFIFYSSMVETLQRNLKQAMNSTKIGTTKQE